MARPTEAQEPADLFNFITVEDFRESLLSDYREMQSALASRAWKSVHVLAGSIIEAILVDYLVASGHTGRDPLKMSLAEAMTACREAGVLSDQAEHLAIVVRDFRNLIHPGKMIRLNGEVDQETAKVADSLVRIILREVAREKRQSYGYTAEQIVTKLEQDASALAILPHLLRQVNVHEKERLLLRIIPQRYQKLRFIEGEDDAALPVLSQAFRLILDDSPADARGKAVAEYVRILKEEDGDTLLSYESAFFRAKDLNYVSGHDFEIIRERLFSRLRDPDVFLMETLEGIGQFLAGEQEIGAFVSGIVRAVSIKGCELSDAARIRLVEEANRMSYGGPETLRRIVHEYLNSVDDGRPLKAVLQGLWDSLNADDDIPF